jgi:hypothetical protein
MYDQGRNDMYPNLFCTFYLFLVIIMTDFCYREEQKNGMRR